MSTYKHAKPSRKYGVENDCVPRHGVRLRCPMRVSLLVPERGANIALSAGAAPLVMPCACPDKSLGAAWPLAIFDSKVSMHCVILGCEPHRCTREYLVLVVDRDDGIDALSNGVNLRCTLSAAGPAEIAAAPVLAKYAMR